MIDSLLVDVEHAVASGDVVQRGTMLRQVAGLFADQADRLADDQVAAFDVVILKLARTVESGDRAVLSEGIADIPNAPLAVVRDLAYDADVAVAGPVLTRSNRVTEADIVAIAKVRGQDHLQCVARRLTLSERVTDVLLIRGDRRVVGSVAENGGARFSERGFGTLARKAHGDPVLRSVLDSRRALPAEQRQRIAPLQAAECDLDEKLVVAWLGEGRITDALTAVARIAHVPTEMAMEAHRAPDYDSLLFLLRAIRFGWGSLKLFLQVRPGKALSPEDMRGAFEAFQALSVTTAQRVVRFKATRDAPPIKGVA